MAINRQWTWEGDVVKSEAERRLRFLQLPLRGRIVSSQQLFSNQGRGLVQLCVVMDMRTHDIEGRPLSKEERNSFNAMLLPEQIAGLPDDTFAAELVMEGAQVVVWFEQRPHPAAAVLEKQDCEIAAYLRAQYLPTQNISDAEVKKVSATEAFMLLQMLDTTAQGPYGYEYKNHIGWSRANRIGERALKRLQEKGILFARSSLVSGTNEYGNSTTGGLHWNAFLTRTITPAAVDALRAKAKEPTT